QRTAAPDSSSVWSNPSLNHRYSKTKQMSVKWEQGQGRRPIGRSEYNCATSLFHISALFLCGVISSSIPLQSATNAPDANSGSSQPEEIRSSQDTVLEPLNGQLDQVKAGAKVFLDADARLAQVPDELLGRTFIRAPKTGAKAHCIHQGYVY